MNWRDEDPAHEAGHKIAQMITISAVLSTSVAQMAQARAQLRMEEQARRAAAAVEATQAEIRHRMEEAEQARKEWQQAYAESRERWETMLNPETREGVDLHDTMACWVTAQLWEEDPLAQRAATTAEERLRNFRPDVMTRYDRLREEGLAPVSAMRQVVDMFDQEPVWERAADKPQQALNEPEHAIVVRPRGDVVRSATRVAEELTPTAAAALSRKILMRMAKAMTHPHLVEQIDTTKLTTSRSAS